MLSLKLIFLLVLVKIEHICSQMEGFIVDGTPAGIKRFPHSAFLDVRCEDSRYICGASILNQRILLTAAHCVVSCNLNYDYIWAVVGHANKEKGSKRWIDKYKAHDGYNEATMFADIAISRLARPLVLGNLVKRIILRESTPKSDNIYVAGWGTINDEASKHTTWLLRAKQKIWVKSECEDTIGEIPDGVFCAGSVESDGGYAAPGDSGCALVVDGYVQIGIVSYKQPEMEKTLIVYTNVSYYYNWIIDHTRPLFCSAKKSNKGDDVE